ncbi:MAG: hypothetical protein AB1715_11890, partial [Acidobacteriota bacterium]
MKNAGFGFAFLTIVLNGACVVAVVDSRFPEGSSLPGREYHETLALDSGKKISLLNRDGNVEGRVVNFYLRVPRSVRLDPIRNGRGDILISDL